MVFETFYIDDRDSQIEYSSGWETPGSGTEYRNTASTTTKQGASFTLRFVGTSFKVYGRLSIASSVNDTGAFPNTTYAMDGGQPTPFFGVPSINGDLLNQLFYASPPLENTKHTLVGTCTDEGGRVILDYIAVELPVDSDSPVNSRVNSSSLPLSATKLSSSSSSSSSTMLITSASNTRLSSLSPPPATEIPITASNSNSRSTPMAVIVGALGGSLFVAITLVFYLLRRLRVRGVAQRSSSKKPVPRLPSMTSSESESTSTTNRLHDVLVCAESHKPPLLQYNNRDNTPPTQ